ALLIMLIIFLFSAQPGSELPVFDWIDAIIKKGGHVIGYGLLAYFYWRALDFRKAKGWLVWLLTVLYALTDEFHQSFVPGRHASLWDVIIFDNLGALISLWLVNYYQKEKRPRTMDPTVEKARR
ncbi:MAG: VanZ family protein, partial [Anaerolineales bacterium]